MFFADGDTLVPTMLSQGPWDPTTLHGGPVAAVLLRSVEQAGPAAAHDAPMRVARFTVDLLRPVPMAPLEVSAEVVRGGRQISIIDAQITHNTKLVARASAALVRCDREVVADDALNAAAVGEPPLGRHVKAPQPFTGPGGSAVTMPGFVGAVDIMRVQGSLGEGVPAEAWAKVKVPLVQGETITPLQRVGLLSDFTSGVGSYMDFLTYVSPNADITCHLMRYPVGEWVGLDAATVLHPDGIGQSKARLFDDAGFLGFTQTTLVISERPERLRPQN
jgi:hypothetical protein